VVWVGGSIIIFLVAVDAFHAHWSEIEERSGGIEVAVVTVGRDVRSYKREAAPLVDLGDVVHDPGRGGMASAAIGSHSLVMHVGMACNTFVPGFGKLQRLVARPAWHGLMLSCQRKLSCAVVKREGLEIDLPSLRIMAIRATDHKSFPVRGGLREQAYGKYQSQY